VFRPALALATLAFFAACSGPAGEPEPAPPLDIAGTYTLATNIQGSAVQGQIEITGEPGAYGGSVFTEYTGRIPIASVTVAGSEVTIVLDSPQGPVTVLLGFTGDTFTGEWSSGDDGGTVEGRKIRS
jgi:hypothetical protein